MTHRTARPALVDLPLNEVDRSASASSPTEVVKPSPPSVIKKRGAQAQAETEGIENSKPQKNNVKANNDTGVKRVKFAMTISTSSSSSSSSSPSTTSIPSSSSSLSSAVAAALSIRSSSSSIKSHDGSMTRTTVTLGPITEQTTTKTAQLKKTETTTTAIEPDADINELICHETLPESITHRVQAAFSMTNGVCGVCAPIVTSLQNEVSTLSDKCSALTNNAMVDASYIQSLTDLLTAAVQSNETLESQNTLLKQQVTTLTEQNEQHKNHLKYSQLLNKLSNEDSTNSTSSSTLQQMGHELDTLTKQYRECLAEKEKEIIALVDAKNAAELELSQFRQEFAAHLANVANQRYSYAVLMQEDRSKLAHLMAKSLSEKETQLEAGKNKALQQVDVLEHELSKAREVIARLQECVRRHEQAEANTSPSSIIDSSKPTTA